MIGGERLRRFCAGGDNAGNSGSAGAVEVVMAMPGGMTGAATANLARPILGDPKVVEMVSIFFCLVSFLVLIMYYLRINEGFRLEFRV